MSCNTIDFVTYCICNLSCRLNLSAVEVYRRLKQSGIFYGYIVPSYDVLHTFGKEYLYGRPHRIHEGERSVVITSIDKNTSIWQWNIIEIEKK